MLFRLVKVFSVLLIVILVTNSIATSTLPTAHAASIVQSISISNPTALAVNPVNNKVYITSETNNTLTVRDENNDTNITFPVDAHPHRVAVNPRNGRVYITHPVSGQVSVLDANNYGVLKKTITFGDPYDINLISINPVTNDVYFAASYFDYNIHGDTGVVRMAPDYSMDGLLPDNTNISDYYDGLNIGPSGSNIYLGFPCVSTWCGQIQVYDADYAGFITRYIGVSDPHSIVSDAVRKRVYLSSVLDNKILIVDDTNNSVIKEVDGRGYQYADYDSSNNHYYGLKENTLDIMDGDTLAVLDSIQVGTKPFAIAVNSNTNQIYVMDANSVYTIEEEGISPPPAGVEPLIFIPGIMGSQLVDDGGVEYWPAPINTVDIGKQSLLLPSSINLHATYPITEVVIPLLKIKKQMPYTSLLKALSTVYRESGMPSQKPLERCERGDPRATLYVFAYDWRQNIANPLSSIGPAVQLKQLVDCIRLKHPGTKVNILTHSMGGLVARRYILDNPEHGVDKLITIAAPWLGAPQFLNALLTGDALQGSLSSALATTLTNEDIMKLIATFPGGWQLSPSKSYFDLGGTRPLTDESWPNGDGKPYEYVAYLQWLDTHYPDVTSPILFSGGAGTVNHQFHTGRTDQDNWKADNTGVSYYHIYGVGDYPDTVYSIRRGWHALCTRIGDDMKCFSPDLNRFRLPVWGLYIDGWGFGDHTVPELSASRIGTDNYNVPSATLRIVRPANGDTEHTNLTQNSNVQSCILDFLQQGSCTILQAPQPVPKDASVRIHDSAASAYYVNIRGVPDITITDTFGNAINTISGTITTDIPNITVHRLNTGQYLVLPNDQTYTVMFRTHNNPLFIEVAKGTGEKTNQLIRYLDLTLPANTNAQLKITSQGVENLRYDDGSGTFANVINPTISVTGSQASNIYAPVVSIKVTGPLDAKSVDITAKATGANNNISAVWYSVDGTTFKRYKQGISINTMQNPTLYVFADDQIGNRSSLLIYSLTHLVYVPVVKR